MNFSTKSVGGISRHIFSSEPSLQSIIPSQCLDASILVPSLHSNNSTWMFLKTGSDMMIYALSFYKSKTILDLSKLLLTCPFFWTNPFCCIVSWSYLTFWFKLIFLLPKNEISFEHFRVYSRTILQIFERLQQLISTSDNKKILLTTRNVRLDSGRYATKYY